MITSELSPTYAWLMANAIREKRALREDFEKRHKVMEGSEWKSKLKKIFAPVAARKPLPKRDKNTPIFHFGGARSGQPFAIHGLRLSPEQNPTDL